MMKWMTKHWMLTLWALSFIIGFIISGDMGGAVYVGIVTGFILFILFGLISLIKDTNKLENRMRAKREKKNKRRR